MALEPSISIGNILTSITILISLITLYLSWRKDSKLKIKEKADVIRKSAALTLKSLERWKEISLSIFYKCDVEFIYTSEMLVFEEKVSDEQLDKARDYLWKKLMYIVAENKNLVFKEEIKNAYFDLYPHYPQIKLFYENTLFELIDIENKMLDEFIAEKTQNEVLHIEKLVKDKYYSALLGNRLRSVRNECLLDYQKQINALTVEIHNILTNIITEKDEKLIYIKRQ
jgi:hypothetical protein